MESFEPILIIVRRDRWDAFPLNRKGYSQRDRWLIQEIKLAGGIDERVPPGMYHFNIVPNPFTGEGIATLIPASRQ